MSLDRFDTASPFGETNLNPGKFDLFMDRHQKGIAVLAVLAVLGAGAFLVYRSIDKNAEITAGHAFTKAEKISGYQAVIKESPGTAAAGSSAILLADQQWTEGSKDESVATLKDFLNNYPDHSALPAAKASLATKLVAQGKSAEAKPLFEDLVNSPDARYIAPFALISLGDLAETSGDTAAAETFYQRARNEFPRSPFVKTANERMTTLKAKAPVEIDAPPAPETTPPAPDMPGMPGASPFLSPSAAPPADMFPTEPEVPADPSPEEMLPVEPEAPAMPELPAEPAPEIPADEGNSPSGS